MAAAQLRLAPAPPLPPGAPPPPVALASLDPAGRTLAAATADGRLSLLPAQAGSTTADADAFVLTLSRGGEPPQPLLRPLAALALLPGGAATGGLLCSQAGSSRRLIFCQHPAAALELGQEGAEAYLLGCHQEPITAIAASSCGRLALSGDAGGGLQLWDLTNGSQLAAVWGGGCAGPVSAARFLDDGMAASARGSLVSVWRHSAEGGLELGAELEAGVGGTTSPAFPYRTVTALAAAGPFLAAGCSDGAALFWQRPPSGAGEFEQQPVDVGGASAEEPAAVQALSISGDGSLLAAAAGAAVSICCAATGQLLGRLEVPEAPVSLLWAAGNQLLALMPGGTVQPLGAPASAPPAGQQVAVSAREAAAAGPRPRRSVRFAEFAQPHPAAAAGLPAAEPAAAVSAGALMAAARLVGARHAAPPPLPTHQLLRGGGRLEDPAVGSSAGQHGSLVAHGLASAVSAAGQPAGGNAAQQASSTRPLYPILDLRALRGLQAAAPAPAPQPGSHPGRRSPVRPRSPAKPASLQNEAKQQAGEPAGVPPGGDSCEAGIAACWQGAEQPSTEQPGDSQGQPSTAGGEAEEDAVPRRPSHLPAPVQQRLALADGEPPASPTGRLSRQRCDACDVLAGGSRPASPAKLALLSQLAQLRREEDEGEPASDGPSRAPACGEQVAKPAPAEVSSLSGSPCKTRHSVRPGVACTLEEQQAGELLPPEVQALTVLELDASLPLADARRQRYARLSRRCKLGRQQAAPEGKVREEQQLEEDSPAKQRAEERPPAASREVQGGGQPACSQEGGDEQQQTAAASADAPAEEQAAAPGSAASRLVEEAEEGFAVGSDTELFSEDEEECQAAEVPGPALQLAVQGESAWAAAAGSSSSGSEAASVGPLLPPAQAAPVLAPEPRLAATMAAAAAAGSVPTGSAVSAQLAQVAGLLCQLDGRLADLSARVQRHAAAPAAGPVGQRQAALAGPAAAPSAANTAPEARSEPPTARAAAALVQPASRSQPPLRPHQPARAGAANGGLSAPAPFAEPASSLAAPQLNSSLLQLHRAAALQEQAAAAAAKPPPLPEEQAQEARRKAATAATTFAPDARLFGPLPPPEAPPASKLSPAKEAALARARKQVDPRWAAEQEARRPRLEDLWVKEERVPQRSGLAPLPPLAVPVPDGRRMVAQFLGLRL